jgi:hypothetical protein
MAGREVIQKVESAADINFMRLVSLIVWPWWQMNVVSSLDRPGEQADKLQTRFRRDGLSLDRPAIADPSGEVETGDSG